MKKWIFIYFILAFSVLYLVTALHKNNGPVSRVFVTGKVVDISTRQSGGRTMYSEIITFELDHKEHRFTEGSYSTIKPKIGRTRKLIVNPQNPSDVHVRAWAWLEKMTPKPIRHNPIIMYLWLMGCAFFAVGWFCSMSYYEFFRRAIIVPGEVTSYASFAGDQCRAVVSYFVEGKKETVISNFKSNLKPKIGTKYDVGLNPDNMQIARIREGLWFFLVFAGVGLACWGGILLVAFIKG